MTIIFQTKSICDNYQIIVNFTKVINENVPKIVQNNEL